VFEAAASNISVDNSNVNKSVQPMIICVCVITICILLAGMLVLQTLFQFFCRRAFFDVQNLHELSYSSRSLKFCSSNGIVMVTCVDEHVCIHSFLCPHLFVL